MQAGEEGAVLRNPPFATEKPTAWAAPTKPTASPDTWLVYGVCSGAPVAIASSRSWSAMESATAMTVPMKRTAIYPAIKQASALPLL